MKDIDETARTSGNRAAIQVICLVSMLYRPARFKQTLISVLRQGSGGGPSEDNVTGLLVRSVAVDWARGSLLAVDAGSHLAAITRILEHDLPTISEHQDPFVNAAPADPPQSADSSPVSSPVSRETPPPPSSPIILKRGPFAGLPLPNASARANAAHIVRSHVSTYLITHPHLDHLSGFAINTASFHATSRPKRLAALPFTVDAIKRHIFNDVIWPNMTDEDGGVGFVSFQRLKEGGDVMVGEGEGRGYIEVCEGLGVKGFKISHGNCMRSGQSASSQRGSFGNASDVYTPGGGLSHGPERRSISLSYPLMTNGADHGYQTPGGGQLPLQSFTSDGNHKHVVDSTVFFIRDCATSKELLVFGDVEPDSVSSFPRLSGIWHEAAPKIATGILTGMFIECSYDDSQPDSVLFGHMAPRHIVAELQSLAETVKEVKISRAHDKAQRKRKRSAQFASTPEPSSLIEAIEKKRSRGFGSVSGRTPGTPLRRSSLPVTVPEEAAPSPLSLPSGARPVTVPTDSSVGDAPLTGMRVVIIHVKDTLKDGPHIGERILRQLNDHATSLDESGWGKLGCEFVISQSGHDYFF